MNIIIPLAGKDKNFEERGMIKPLTKVQGKEIIKWISESRPYSFKNAIFIILKEHQENYNLSEKLKEFFGETIKIIILDEMTKGSPQSILRAESYIDNSEELIIDLGDQYLDLTGFNDFLEENKEKCDGIISSFESYYWNRGYMNIDDLGYVTNVMEKSKPSISTHSTACISYFKKGSDFVKYAKRMIENKRTAANGVYLPSLAYNEMIEDRKKIITFPCELIAPLGTVQGADCFDQIDKPFKWKQQVHEKIILHRGYLGKYAENSLKSFEQALTEGYPTEIDIRITKDNIPVIIHDDNLMRTYGVDKTIKDNELEELRKYPHLEDESERLPTLKEICEKISEVGNKDSLVFIHIKELEDIPKTIEVIKNYSIDGSIDERLRFVAVDELIEDFIRLMKTNYPEYEIGLHLFENSPHFTKEMFEEVDFIWIDEIAFKWIDKEKVELAHRLNKPIYAISPELIKKSIFNENIKNRWEELLKIGVDRICTDLPEDFSEVFK